MKQGTEQELQHLKYLRAALRNFREKRDEGAPQADQLHSLHLAAQQVAAVWKGMEFANHEFYDDYTRLHCISWGMLWDAADFLLQGRPSHAYVQLSVIEGKLSTFLDPKPSEEIEE